MLYMQLSNTLDMRSQIYLVSGHYAPTINPAEKEWEKFLYSLRPILLFANADVSTTKLCLDTSILAKSIMGRRE
jgi:hypothetical protein